MPTRLFCAAIACRPSSYARPKADSPPPFAYSRSKKEYCCSKSASAPASGLGDIFIGVFHKNAQPGQGRRHFREETAPESGPRLSEDFRGREGSRQIRCKRHRLRSRRCLPPRSEVRSPAGQVGGAPQPLSAEGG